MIPCRRRKLAEAGTEHAAPDSGLDAVEGDPQLVHAIAAARPSARGGLHRAPLAFRLLIPRDRFAA
jgi:hypothetical protein